MSWTDKELSEMANTAQSEQKFAYDDSFWGEVEAMLPAKKKRVFPFLWFAAIPMVAVVGYLAVSANQNIADPVQAARTMEMETPILLAQFTNQDIVESDRNSNDADYSKPVSNTKQTNQMSSQVELEKTNLELQTPSAKGNFSDAIGSEGSNQTSDLNKKIKSDENHKTKHNSFEAKPLTFNSLAASFQAAESTTPKKSIIEKTVLSSTNESVDFLKPLTIGRFDSYPSQELGSFMPMKRSKFWNGYAEAGFAMGQSFASSQVGHTSAVNFGFGARFDMNNYFFQFGLGAEMQNVKLEVNQREKVYHTSSTVFENIFSYKQLYRIEAPITIGYQFPKHAFQLSVIPAYLLGAKMNYSHLENGSMMRDETLYETEYGNKVAWNDFSTTFAVGYGYRLTRTVTLGANIRWQLMNQLNNDITTEGNVRPFSGQVFIRKTLR